MKNNMRLAVIAAVFLLLAAPACKSFSSNGQRIFLDATSASGQPIVASGFTMPMAHPTCAGCHQPDGRGGSIAIMMNRYDVPNITWPQLSIANDDRPAYNEQSLKQAITTGEEPSGEHLEYPMPQWQMSSQDLENLVSFIKTLK